MNSKRFRPEIFVYLDQIGLNLYGKHKYNTTWADFRLLGNVIDETKFTLVIQDSSSTKTYIKNQYIFRCWLPQSNGIKKLIQYDGDKIVGNPENRIKLIRKKHRRKLH
ncbi:ribonuclease P protein subunit [Candidatus Lokiarchaeum ossiferum]|uniref:ribonuclease P protein subunit n=1 Tax=Candidatus Lokiarchaeum ossiferum TaxID=2951803 RepID=UPI00352EC6D4